jgi:hypothetical protein
MDEVWLNRQRYGVGEMESAPGRGAKLRRLQPLPGLRSVSNGNPGLLRTPG